MTGNGKRLLGLLVCAASLLTVWIRGPITQPSHANILNVITEMTEPPCCKAGPLILLESWRLESPNVQFGGYSALLHVTPERLLTFSDRGYFLDFAEPGAASGAARFGSTLPGSGAVKTNRDIEAATWNPATGQLWLAQEGQNAVARYGPGMRLEVRRKVPEWRDWPSNSGVEAFVRLRDGRFIALCECRDGWFGEFRHPATIHSGDPTDARPAEAFTFAGVDGYRPTDMAQLPDGRVLILMRRLLWPVPARFAIKVALADPAEIRPGQVWRATEIADLSAPWPVDNYEGLAIERQLDGKLIAWIISDENGAVSQRVLLLKVRIDEAALPPKQKAPG